MDQKDEVVVWWWRRGPEREDDRRTGVEAGGNVIREESEFSSRRDTVGYSQTMSPEGNRCSERRV